MGKNDVQLIDTTLMHSRNGLLTFWPTKVEHLDVSGCMLAHSCVCSER